MSRTITIAVFLLTLVLSLAIACSNGNSTPTHSTPPTRPPNYEATLQNARDLMVDLVNEERAKAGVLPRVELGHNQSVQTHAEASLANCYGSHWNAEGLKPYMRYSATGGHRFHVENAHGLNYCYTSENGAPLASIDDEVRGMMRAWMNSELHGEVILSHLFTDISVGIAWDPYNVRIYQLFESGDYINFEQMPAIDDNGLLTMAGTSQNGAKVWDLYIDIYYDPPPETLSRGQLARTYCYDNGRPVGFIPSQVYRVVKSRYETTYTPCPDPYQISDGASPPDTQQVALAYFREAVEASTQMAPVPATVLIIQPTVWSASPESFNAAVPITPILEENGPGVYTFTLWGVLDSQDTPISRYSVFYQVDAPRS